MRKRQAHCTCPSCYREPVVDWRVIAGGIAAALVGWVATVLAIVALS